MLDAIFGSTVRVKILNLLLLNPEKKYYLQQLARDLDCQASSIRHEIDNLIRFGLLLEESQADAISEQGRKVSKKYFRVNSDFLIYPEIKALFTKAQILFSQKFISGLQKICEPKFLALTGVFINNSEAQTDLLVVGNVRRSTFLKLIKELEQDLGREINYTIFDEKEFLYRQEIMDIFLYNILEGKSLILINSFSKQK